LPFRRGWEKLKAWFVHLLHLDDSAHRIALGVAIGMFVAVTPTWGIQMILVVGLAWLCRANKVAGVPMVWVTNPATNIPIYSFCYIVGQSLVGGPGWDEVKHRIAGASDSGLNWWEWGYWWQLIKCLLALTWDGAAPLWVGTCVVGAVAGVIMYVMMYYLITVYRRRHARHLAAAGKQAPAEAPPYKPGGPAAGCDNSGDKAP
jgi:uncharacterized protein (DUF2062 family)